MLILFSLWSFKHPNRIGTRQDNKKAKIAQMFVPKIGDSRDPLNEKTAFVMTLFHFPNVKIRGGGANVSGCWLFGREHALDEIVKPMQRACARPNVPVASGFWTWTFFGTLAWLSLIKGSRSCWLCWNWAEDRSARLWSDTIPYAQVLLPFQKRQWQLCKTNKACLKEGINFQKTICMFEKAPPTKRTPFLTPPVADQRPPEPQRNTEAGHPQFPKDLRSRLPSFPGALL